MNGLFNQVSSRLLVCSLEGIGEVVSILVRQRNRGKISDDIYRQALSDLHSEISNQKQVEKIRPTSSQVTDSWSLIETHSINSSDAIILKCVLDMAPVLKAGGHNLALVSSDARLVRAAKAEGLSTFNPETDDQAALDALIN